MRKRAAAPTEKAAPTTHTSASVDNDSQQKKLCSLVLKLKRRAALYFQVLTGALHTVYRSASSLFLKCTSYFFLRERSSKAIAIGVSEVSPLVEIG